MEVGKQTASNGNLSKLSQSGEVEVGRVGVGKGFHGCVRCGGGVELTVLSVKILSKIKHDDYMRPVQHCFCIVGYPFK